MLWRPAPCRRSRQIEIRNPGCRAVVVLRDPRPVEEPEVVDQAGRHVLLLGVGVELVDRAIRVRAETLGVDRTDPHTALAGDVPAVRLEAAGDRLLPRLERAVGPARRVSL